MFKRVYNILLLSSFKVYVKAENTCLIAKMRIKKWIILFYFEIRRLFCYSKEEETKLKNDFLQVTNKVLKDFEEESYYISYKHEEQLNRIINN